MFRSRALTRIFSLALILSAGSGCVEKSLYTQALADVQFARNQAADANTKLKAAQDQITGLKGDIDARDAKLNEMTAADADLKRKFEELNVLNATLADRLQKAGQSVETLSTEKGSLAQSLAETRRQLDELKKQQAAAEARAAEFQALINRFQKLADAGKLKVVLRDGRMIIELPNDVLFDSGKDELKSEGKTTLVEVAKVLKTVSGRRFQVAGHTDNVKDLDREVPFELGAIHGARRDGHAPPAGQRRRSRVAFGGGLRRVRPCSRQRHAGRKGEEPAHRDLPRPEPRRVRQDGGQAGATTPAAAAPPAKNATPAPKK